MNTESDRKLGGSMTRYKEPKDGLPNDELKRTVSEYQAYLDQYPRGKYASLAKQRLKSCGTHAKKQRG